MDLSSEMIHALFPLYLVTVLGASMLTVGMIEGMAEAIAMITKIFSGALSDYIGKRKVLAALGYGLAAFTKPIFPLAPTIGWLMTARFVDRVGKGIRGAPRDALIADLAPEDLRGASYGLRQSLDTVGAVLGPLLALTLMYVLADNFTAVFCPRPLHYRAQRRPPPRRRPRRRPPRRRPPQRHRPRRRPPQRRPPPRRCRPPSTHRRRPG